MKTTEFELNDYLVSVGEDGVVRVFTNNTQDQKDGILVKEYIEGMSGNRLSLLLEEQSTIYALFNILRGLRGGNMERVYNFPYRLETGAIDSIKDNGCVTLFTTNKNLQFDANGRGYADRNNFKVLKVNKVKKLH